MANVGTRGRGRPKGSKNKLTADVKEAILLAFKKIGGKRYLVHVAQYHPAVFCALLGKILPAEVKAEIADLRESGDGVQEVIVRTRVEAAALMGPKELPDVPAIE